MRSFLLDAGAEYRLRGGFRTRTPSAKSDNDAHRVKDVNDEQLALIRHHEGGR